MDDDIIAFRGDAVFQWYLDEFNKHFDESDDSASSRRDRHEFLGLLVEQHRDARTITVSAPRLIDKLTHVAGPHPKYPPSTPIVPQRAQALDDPVSENNPIVPQSEYDCRSVLGLILWIAHACRPDVMFASSLIARYTSRPPTRNIVHAVQHLAWYIVNTREHTLTFHHDTQHELLAYVDASFANDLETRRSWYSYVLVWAGAAVAYQAKLSSCVAPSTRDAEIIAAVQCVKQVIAYRILLSELGVSPCTATKTYIDNLACVDGVANERVHRDSRWQAIRLAFVRQQVRDMIINLLHISGTDNLADIGTKALPKSTFGHLAPKVLGIAPIPEVHEQSA